MCYTKEINTLNTTWEVAGNHIYMRIEIVSALLCVER